MLADVGIPLHVLQGILGHKSRETMRGYLHTDHRNLADAATKPTRSSTHRQKPRPGMRPRRHAVSRRGGSGVRMGLQVPALDNSHLRDISDRRDEGLDASTNPPKRTTVKTEPRREMLLIRAFPSG